MKPLSMDWKKLRFGVEIEYVGGKPEEVVLLPGWIMSLDERQTDDTGEESGSELKPPPLKWNEREQIREMLKRLRAAGASANWNCGLHVHVSLEPWGQEVIPLFIDASFMYQDAVRGLLHTSEDRLMFCPPVTAEMRDRYMSDPGQDSLRRTGRPQSHRCGINLAAWFDIGTVEIRYANGTLDYQEVINTIEFCLRFVTAIAEGRRLPCDPQQMALELGAPLNGYPQPIPAPRWYRERMWLENALVPILTPIAKGLVQDGEIHHILPGPDGILVAIEANEEIVKYLFQLPSTGWEAVRRLAD